MSRPKAVRVSCILLFASAVMFVTWAIATWSKHGEFDRAVERIFNAVNAVQYTETTVGWLQFLYAAGAALSIVFGVLLIIAGVFIYRGSGWARVLAWIAGALSLPVIWLTFIRNGADYLNGLGTGLSDAVGRAEMATVNQLTPWRFAGWYHVMTMTFGIAIACSIIGLLTLLSLPSSGAFFIRARLSDLIDGRWGQYH